jgi:hypothetical protein
MWFFRFQRFVQDSSRINDAENAKQFWFVDDRR